MFVMTLDQRSSRQGPDLVPQLLDHLADLPAEVPFERSVGDELQGILTEPHAVVEAALRALRSGQWYVGIGIGGVESPLPASPREGRGTAFVAARGAVDRAKKTGERVPLAVVAAGADDPAAAAASTAAGKAGAAAGNADPRAAAAAAEAVLVLVGALVAGRSAAEWRVLDQLEPGVRGGQSQAAAALGISAQAVSRAVLRSGWHEERGGRQAAELLLGLADS
ncbi:hypothetical protein [Arthrobacter sp. 35W]|uniref:hypothetical protein n=1 Tax=Arthrobacter sp. 35W TaxID=1132441 RepID=UPI00040C24F3|nr:hypothetical protein [Arthrobacter sp. 35W]